jgi:hypothetical protein
MASADELYSTCKVHRRASAGLEITETTVSFTRKSLDDLDLPRPSFDEDKIYVECQHSLSAQRRLLRGRYDRKNGSVAVEIESHPQPAFADGKKTPECSWKRARDFMRARSFVAVPVRNDNLP